MRYHFPQPWQEMPHTADVAVAVEGATAEETLARLVLALTALLAGGGGVTVDREEPLAVSGRGDLSRVAVNVLRELLYRFSTERLLAGSCEVLRLDRHGAELSVGFGRWDPERHPEGTDVKAITYHAARFEPVENRWRAQAVFDI